MTAELQGFIDRVTALFDTIDAQFVSQNALAKTAIELWGLKNVAIIGGGAPTPLSPQPEQVLYFTDINPEVVEAVSRLGFNALCVDVKSAESVKSLTGATTMIASGLIHFLDDDMLRQVFVNLREAGFQTVVFNNVDTNASEELMANWTKLGYTFYPRSPADLRNLLPPGWRLAQAVPMTEFYQHNAEIGAQLAQLENIHHIFLVERE